MEFAQVVNTKHMEDLTKTHYLLKKEECSICLDDILPTNLARAPCGHQFCFTCVLRAFCESNACPYCRTEFIEMPSEEDSDEEWEEEDEDDNRTVDSNGWETCSDSEEEDEPEPEAEEKLRFMENQLFRMEDCDVGGLY
jgi:Ring finger domain